MAKIPKVIQNEADLLAIDQALHGPDERVQLEAAQKLIEKLIETIDPQGQILKGHAGLAFAVLERGLDDPNPEERTVTARVILKFDPEGLRLLERKPKLGIARARKLVRDWKKKFEDEEKSHPAN